MQLTSITAREIVLGLSQHTRIQYFGVFYMMSTHHMTCMQATNDHNATIVSVSNYLTLPFCDFNSRVGLQIVQLNVIFEF